MLRRLRLAAANREVSPSAMARQLLADGLDRYESEQAAMSNDGKGVTP
jgi:hypothetical protein